MHAHVCLRTGGVWRGKLSSYPLGHGHPRQINEHSQLLTGLIRVHALFGGVDDNA